MAHRLTARESEHFLTHGWLRLTAVFSAADAEAMRDVVWCALAGVGILRDDPATWTQERPQHLQQLKSDPAFRAVGNERTLAAIDALLQGQPWKRPSDWGSFFIVFPASRPWDLPADGWHLDHDYLGPLSPPKGLKVHAMFGDVVAQAGGMCIIDGSPRMVHRWFQDHPPREGARAAHLRASLHQHPYLRDLCTPGDPAARRARFHDRVDEVDGIQLRVLENMATAGDVILMHPLLLHAPPAAHVGTGPRFLLNKDLFL